MRFIHGLIMSTVLCLPIAAHAQTAPLVAPPTPTVSVTGEASVDVSPDIATLSMGVTTQGKTATEAMSANSAQLTTVLDRLKAAGIAAQDLQTSNLSLNPNWVGYDTGSTPTIAGYTASNMLNVRVRALDGLGAVLDAAITDGANTLNGLTFDVANPRPAMDRARSAAVADAVARATLLVTAAGGTLGPVLSISESSNYVNPQPMFRAETASAPVPVAQGQVGITASVTVVFAIKQ